MNLNTQFFVASLRSLSLTFQHYPRHFILKHIQFMFLLILIFIWKQVNFIFICFYDSDVYLQTGEQMILSWMVKAFPKFNLFFTSSWRLFSLFTNVPPKKKLNLATFEKRFNRLLISWERVKFQGPLWHFTSYTFSYSETFLTSSNRSFSIGQRTTSGNFCFFE